MIATTICPKCEAKINHNEEDTPRRCVGCHTDFVKAEDVVVIGEPTVIKVKPLKVGSKAKGGK
jgi:NAD-dependent DNA ligase